MLLRSTDANPCANCVQHSSAIEWGRWPTTNQDPRSNSICSNSSGRASQQQRRLQHHNMAPTVLPTRAQRRARPNSHAAASHLSRLSLLAACCALHTSPVRTIPQSVIRNCMQLIPGQPLHKMCVHVLVLLCAWLYRTAGSL